MRRFPVISPSFERYVTDLYRAPELWAKKCLTIFLSPPADIWSAGCVVFEVLSGEVLFHMGYPAVAAWCKSFELLKKGRLGSKQWSSFAKLSQPWRELVVACCNPDRQSRSIKLRMVPQFPSSTA